MPVTHPRRRRAVLVALVAVFVTVVAVGGAAAMTRSNAGTLSLAASAAGGNPSANLDQCANGSGTPQGTTCEWINGNLGASKSLYMEGDSIAYRMRFDNLPLTSHTVEIKWDTAKSDKHALDYLTTYNRTITGADPCLDVTGCSSSDTEAIPADTQVTGAGVTPIGGNFTLFGGTITAVSAYSYPSGTGFTGDKSATITITFTASVANPVLAWGGHIATRADWGMTNSAVSIPGSPYHMALVDLDGSGGSQDRSLSADAVIFPGSITIIKEATPEGSTSFPFTASPAPLANFGLVDPSDNTKVFSNITTFATYTVAETVPSTWLLTGATCSATSPNGGSYSFTSPSVSIGMKEGENWTCTFSDQQQTGTLIVKKLVTNDDGGTAVSSDWQIHVKSGSSDVAGSPQAGNGTTGTSYTLPVGSYAASETGGPSGYTGPVFGGDCDSSGNVTVAYNQTKTCTLTNNDAAPQLKLVKSVVNDDGGTAVANDWTLYAAATSPNDGRNFNNTGGSGTFHNVFAGAGYTLTESSGPTGYSTTGEWSCDGGTLDAAKHVVTLGVGAQVTCTITNNDVAPTLKLVKSVTNDDGGTGAANDWTLYAAAASPDNGRNFSNAGGSGTFQNVYAGVSYALSESTVAGYSSTGEWSCDGGTLNAAKNAVTVPLGGQATCTIVNNDVAPKLKLVKSVTNDDGGSAVPDGWTLSATAATPNDGRNFTNLGGSGTLHTVYAGASYVLAETGGPSGYTSTGEWSCDGGTLNAAKNAVTLAVGAEVTCTIVNNDTAPKLKLVKSVVNDDGGSAGPADWQLAAAASSPSDGRNFTSQTATPSFHSVFAGVSYGLSESGGPAGYSTTGEWSCDGGTLNAAKNAVTVPVGAEVTCTIVNTDDTPQLKLVKSVVNDNGGSAVADNWTLAAAAGSPNDGRNFTNAGGSGVYQNVFAGVTYALSESGGPSGYTSNGQWSCDGGTLNAAKNAVAVALGAHVTCTITNTDNAPKLKLVKSVVNDDGGLAVPDNWTLAAAASAPKDGRNFSNAGGSGTFQNVFAGVSYVLSESGGPAGYSTTGEWTCDGGTLNAAKNAITLPLDVQVTCTIVNTDNKPQLKLVKSVVNDDGGTAGPADWLLSAAAASPDNGRNFTSQTATPAFHDVLAGVSYDLSESGGPAGYSSTGEWTCDGGTMNAAKTSITVALGAQVTCTIANTDDTPQLKLVKSVVNDNGGMAAANDWTLYAAAASPNNGRNFNNAGGSGAFQNVLAGAEYALSESAGPSGYATTGEWTCDGGTLNAAKNAVTVALGAHVTCTITNNDQPGHIIVKKQTKPTGAPDSFNFDATGTGTVDFALSDGQQNDQTLDAGSYTVKELVPAGWVLTGLACTVTGGGASTGVGDLATQTATISLKVGDTVTCTFQNTGQMTTRTQGFWATHPELAWAAWYGGTAGGHDFGSGVAGAGLDTSLCGRPIDTAEKLMSGFWSDISKKSTGAKRSSLDQAKMQLLQQLLAAELNASAFGAAPSVGSFAAWESALCSTNVNAVKTAAQQAASFNTAGDSGVWTPGMSADAKAARSLAVAQATFWDVFS